MEQLISQQYDPNVSWFVFVKQGTSGAQATLQRLTNETAITIQKIQADVKAKKQQVRCWSHARHWASETSRSYQQASSVP
jgi:hypothetical protein